MAGGAWPVGIYAMRTIFAYMRYLCTYKPRQLYVVHGPLTQIRKIAGCACAGKARRSRHASRHVRDTHAVMHVGIAISRWRRKRSWHSWRIRNPQFYLSGERSMARHCCADIYIWHFPPVVYKTETRWDISCDSVHAWHAIEYGVLATHKVDRVLLNSK